MHPWQLQRERRGPHPSRGHTEPTKASDLDIQNNNENDFDTNSDKHYENDNDDDIDIDIDSDTKTTTTTKKMSKTRKIKRRKTKNPFSFHPEDVFDTNQVRIRVSPYLCVRKRTELAINFLHESDKLVSGSRVLLAPE